MKYVEIVSESGSIDTIRAIADKEFVFDMRVGPVCEDGMRQIRLLVKDDGLGPDPVGAGVGAVSARVDLAAKRLRFLIPRWWLGQRFEL